MWSTTITIPSLFEDMTYKVNDSYIKKRGGGAIKIVYKVLKDRNTQRKYLQPLDTEHDNTRPSTGQTKE